MKEQHVPVATPSGPMETFVTHPSENGPYPAVVIYMDIWGVREELFDIARRVATVGYYCLVPDLYHRQGRIRNEFRNEKNQMISLERLDPEKQELVRAPWRNLTHEMVLADTRALLEFIDRGEPVHAGAVGVVGYCMGGRHAFLAAGHFPDRFRASASLHGTRFITDEPDSPHLLAPKLRGELYCGFPEHDPGAPATMIKALSDTLHGCNVRYHHEIHRGVEHGYALPDRDIYDKRAANRDWELIFAMFHRQIPPYQGGHN